MGLKITVTDDDFPKDTEFGITGLGLFVNGKARDVTPEEEERYKAFTGEGVSKIKSASIKVEGSNKGGDN